VKKGKRKTLSPKQDDSNKENNKNTEYRIRSGLIDPRFSKRWLWNAISCSLARKYPDGGGSRFL
jgi:hypothetical protein